MYNSGQVCVAIKRLFVHEDQYNDMVAALAQQAKHSIVGNGLEKGTHFGCVSTLILLPTLSYNTDGVLHPHPIRDESY